MGLRTVSVALILTLASTSLVSCMSAYRRSVGGETERLHTQIFLTDFNTAWQATLEALKSSRLDVTNREGGFIQTKWDENTAEKNFIDSFGNADSYLKAQVRYRITVAKGFFNGKPSVKVNVQKEQLIKRDVLEGWKPVETNSIEENTLLYRIGRIITVKMKLAKLEQKKLERAMENVEF